MVEISGDVISNGMAEGKDTVPGTGNGIVELQKLRSIEEDEAANYHSNTPSSLPETTRRVLRGPLAPVNNFLNFIEDGTRQFYNDNKPYIKATFLVLFLTGYTIYFVFALTNEDRDTKDLVYVTVFGALCFIYWLLKKYCGKTIWKTCLKPIRNVVKSFWKFIKWISIFLFIVFVIFWICYDTIKEPERLISLVGLFTYILIGFLFSKHRDQIKWRPVLWGFALQFIFGLLILRTKIGFGFFKWLGDRVTIFLSFSDEGATFLFRGLTQFAFTVLPVIVFFSAVTYLCYYLGILQIVIKKIAWVLSITMGTSPAESVNAAGNIFIGQTEAPLLIRPFLEGMTESELHAVMTGGFATIAGSVLAAYVNAGISATHLLSASVMSAPAALAMAKLMYPETEETQYGNVDEIEIEETDEKNGFEALAVGASMSIGLVANIAVMLLAFLSMLKFINTFLGWLGGMVGEPDFSFEFMCSYVFMPFAYVMGVEWNDSFKVAELLGTKTFLNEFIAYERLAKLIQNRLDNNDQDKLSIRSEVIAIYALCGFANFGSMGVQLGGIGALAPERRPALARVVLRALIAGTLACFMTACIAGLLYNPNAAYDTTLTPAPTVAQVNATVATMLNTTSAF